MTLRKLLGTSLDAIAPDKTLLAKLLAAAERSISDAQVEGLSTESQFDAAYKAIMQLATVALRANGYRSLTSKPGHHQTSIQTLTLTVGLSQARAIVLDALRKQRNLSVYSGDPVPISAASECLDSAKYLLAHVHAWLKSQKPELI
jgi:hypothetical protein